MKVSFFSNYLNHHQLPFCKEMYRLLENDFRFIATKPLSQERLALGWEDISNRYPFSINSYESHENYNKALDLGYNSDIVIIGSAPRTFIDKRLQDNKITFYYSERILKGGRWRLLNPRLTYSLIRNHTFHRNKQLYMMCASAYTSADFNLIGAYRNKAFKWGYFTIVKEHDIDQLIEKKRKNNLPKVLWAGRFIDLKHPDDVVRVAGKLKENGYNFELIIIGTGPLEYKLKDLIKKYNLDKNVTLVGRLSPEEVLDFMEKSNIYIFTSDFNEGWGAVLNESMSSGCAVVASHAIGSVPYLMKNNINGIIYKNGDQKHLFKSIQMLLDNNMFCERLGREAYITMSKTWNAKVASERLVSLFEHLLQGKTIEYQDGPCSKAEIISQRYNY